MNQPTACYNFIETCNCIIKYYEFNLYNLTPNNKDCCIKISDIETDT